MVARFLHNASQLVESRMCMINENNSTTKAILIKMELYSPFDSGNASETDK